MRTPMHATTPPRRRLQALARPGAVEVTVAVPLALPLAARIQERDWEAFTTDATQLANGLRDLVDACAPDGVPIITPEVLTSHGPPDPTSAEVAAALEATRRLRATMGDRLALVAVLPGPGAFAGADVFLELGKAFLGAGADALVLLEHHAEPAALSTLANVARFHQAVAFGCCAEQGGLPTVERVGLAEPRRGAGLVLTDEVLPRNTDVTVLQDWVVTVRG
jgi:hypothetical protein